MKYFGTDGIRLKSTEFTPEFLASVVRGLIDYAGENARVLIGGDTRESTEWILSELETLLETFGVDYGNVGVLPTPAIHYCFSRMGFNFAIDITASHNPYSDNGIKIFEAGEHGPRKLCEDGRKAIENSIAKPCHYALISPTWHASLHDDAVDLYLDHLREYVGDVDFTGLRIGMDCANGAMSVIGNKLFLEFGAEVDLINANPGYHKKINRNCGSTHLGAIRKLVKEKHLDFGVAFDGDGDRCLMVDAKGNEIDGDHILAILTNFLGVRTLATTVMANQGLLNWAQDEDLIFEVTPVGDSQVIAAMHKNSLDIGGEQSGHIILPGQRTGDGMLTALMVAKAVATTGKSLAKLANIIKKLPQIMVNFRATEPQKAAFLDGAADALLAEYSQKLIAISGRLLVRPSGTEDLIRVTMWGNDADRIEQWAHELAEKMKKALS